MSFTPASTPPSHPQDCDSPVPPPDTFAHLTESLLHSELKQHRLQGEIRRLRRIISSSYFTETPVAAVTSSGSISLNYRILEDQVTGRILHDYGDVCKLRSQGERSAAVVSASKKRIRDLRKKLRECSRGGTTSSGKEQEQEGEQEGEIGSSWAPPDHRPPLPPAPPFSLPDFANSDPERVSSQLEIAIRQWQARYRRAFEELESAKRELGEQQLELEALNHPQQGNGNGIDTKTTKIVSVPAPDPTKGEITIVFTDIEDSSALWEMNVEVMAEAVATHNVAVRRLGQEFGGYEVKNDGDGFMFAFSESYAALRFSIEVQNALVDRRCCNWPETMLAGEGYELCHPTYAPVTVQQTRSGVARSSSSSSSQSLSSQLLWIGLRVRIVLSIGEAPGVVAQWNPTIERFDYVGRAPNVAGRLLALARGGEICLIESLWHRIQETFAAQEGEDQQQRPPKRMHGTLVSAWKRGCFALKGVEELVDVVSLVPWQLRARQFKVLDRGSKFHLVVPSSCSLSSSVKKEREEEEGKAGDDGVFPSLPTATITASTETETDPGRRSRLHREYEDERTSVVLSEREAEKMERMWKKAQSALRDALSIYAQVNKLLSKGASARASSSSLKSDESVVEEEHASSSSSSSSLRTVLEELGREARAKLESVLETYRETTNAFSAARALSSPINQKMGRMSPRGTRSQMIVEPTSPSPIPTPTTLTFPRHQRPRRRRLKLRNTPAAPPVQAPASAALPSRTSALPPSGVQRYQPVLEDSRKPTAAAAAAATPAAVFQRRRVARPRSLSMGPQYAPPRPHRRRLRLQKREEREGGDRDSGIAARSELMFRLSSSSGQAPSSPSRGSNGLTSDFVLFGCGRADEHKKSPVPVRFGRSRRRRKDNAPTLPSVHRRPNGGLWGD